MFNCPGCGVDMHFSPEKQLLVCEACGTECSPQEYNKTKLIGASEREDATMAVTVYTCPQCGGELMTEDLTAATFCSYCGASVVLEKRIVEQVKPNYVIPFQLNEKQCEEAMRKKIDSIWFGDSSFTEALRVSKYRAIYIPYYRYGYSTNNANFEGTGKRTYTRGDYTITDHYKINVHCAGDVNDATFDGTSSFADNLAENISPYDMNEMEKFHPAFLSGFYADTNDVPSEVYEDDAHEAGDIGLLNAVKQTDEFKSETATLTSTSFGKLNRSELVDGFKTETILMPVWFMSLRSGDNRVSYAVVNGQTGKVAAEIPISKGKVFGFAMVLAVGLFFLFNLFLELSHSTTMMIANIIGLIAFFQASSVKKEIKARESATDDKGFMHALTKGMDEQQIKKVTRERLNAVNTGIAPWILLLGVFFGVYVWWFEFVDDVWYYGSSIGIGALISLVFIQIISKHNRLMTRPLPQFNKRGGEI